MSPHLRDRGWLTRKLHRAWALPWTEWLFLIQAAILLPAVVLGLKLLPFKTLLALLQRRGTVVCDAWGKGIVNPDRAAYLIDMVSRYHVLKPTCLQKALILYGLLRRKGVEVELMIGVTKIKGALEAHAWLEYHQRVILGGPVERYAPLHGFDGAAALARNIERQTP